MKGRVERSIEALKSHGFEVVTYPRGEELLAACASRLPNCLLMDLDMPGLNGFEVLEPIAARSNYFLALRNSNQLIRCSLT